MQTINLNGIEYELVENKKDAFDAEMIKKLYTSYFENYDYILGDRAYGKIRLKGFCLKNNKNFNEINDFSGMQSYLEDYCAKDCGYFLLKKTIQN